MYLLGALPLVLYLLGVLWHEKSLFCLPTKETFFSYIRLRRVILLRSDLRAPLIPTVGAALAAARRPLVPLAHHRGRSRTAAEEPCLPLRGRCRAQRGGRGPSVILRSAATKDPAPGASLPCKGNCGLASSATGSARPLFLLSVVFFGCFLLDKQKKVATSLSSQGFSKTAFCVRPKCSAGEPIRLPRSFFCPFYFSAKKSRLLKPAVMKRQAAFPVVSHSMWALFFVFPSIPFTRCSATTSG